MPDSDGMVTAKEILNPNRALMEEAREMLEDEGFCLALERWLKRQPPTVQGYSEQNQAMLLLQVMARPRGRNFKFVEPLHTFHGWLDAGRGVMKGQKGFVISSRVTAPNPKDENGDPEKDEKGNDKKGGMKGFRWMYLFDITQTEELTPEQVAARKARKEAPQKSTGKKGKRR